MPTINQNQFHAKTSSYESSTQLASINTLIDSTGQIGTTNQYLRTDTNGEIIWSALGAGVPGTTCAIGVGGPIYGNSGSILTSLDNANQPVWTEPVALKATNDANTNVTGTTGIHLISDELTNVSGGNRSAFQVGSSYSTSTGYFTAPYDRLYYFHTSVLWDTNAFAQNYTGVYIGLSNLSAGDQALIINQTGANEPFNANFTQKLRWCC